MQIQIPEQNIQTFRDALEALNSSSVPYAIGGAFAMYHYTDMWRNTNDLDIYLERESLDKAVDALLRNGFRNYGEMAPGDNDWIYHATRNNLIVDLIWEPPNHVWRVNGSYVERAEKGEFMGIPTSFLPADELILSKLFTLNRHRCDWFDVFHIIKACPENLDWQLVLKKMNDYWPVLLSFIILFDWTYPDNSGCIPISVRMELLKRKDAEPLPGRGQTREALLDPWIYTRSIAD